MFILDYETRYERLNTYAHVRLNTRSFLLILVFICSIEYAVDCLKVARKLVYLFVIFSWILFIELQCCGICSDLKRIKSTLIVYICVCVLFLGSGDCLYTNRTSEQFVTNPNFHLQASTFPRLSCFGHVAVAACSCSCS